MPTTVHRIGMEIHLLADKELEFTPFIELFEDNQNTRYKAGSHLVPTGEELNIEAVGRLFEKLKEESALHLADLLHDKGLGVPAHELEKVDWEREFDPALASRFS